MSPIGYEEPMSDEVERLSRTRRAFLAAQGVLFLAFQAGVFASLDTPIETWSGANWMKAAAYAFWAGVLVFILAKGGFPFRGSPEARAAMNDELTRANRAAGY